MRTPILASLLSPVALVLASCGTAATGESAAPAASAAPFTVAEHGTFNEPWAMAFVPGTTMLVITERGGTMRFIDTANGRAGTVTGLPRVAYGGQGGLGDVAFLPGETSADGRRTIYLSWAEDGTEGTRGAVVGRGTLNCSAGADCAVEGLSVIWRQAPKVTGQGHYSHRLAFSPDGRHLFVASGDRQKMEPAQDMAGNLGKIVRLLPDGTPAPDNPFANRGGVTAQVWSLGHRNILGLEFDAQGRLWDLEHGPAGGDELNLVRSSANFGWPVASDGDHYDGRAIPRHATRSEFAAPAISWNPVIAPGGFVFVRGGGFADWQGNALIGAMKPAALVRVAIDGDKAREVARYPMDKRIRAIEQGPDGTIWLLEDKAGGRLLSLVPAKR